MANASIDTLDGTKECVAEILSGKVDDALLSSYTAQKKEQKLNVCIDVKNLIVVGDPGRYSHIYGYADVCYGWRKGYRAYKKFREV